MEEEQQATLADTIRESIATVTGETPETTTEASPTETEAQREERLRDEKGRFAAKTDTAEPPKPDGSSPVAAQPEVPAVSTRPDGCPSSWPKELWGHWAKMNSDVQLTPKEARQLAEFSGKREGQFASGVSTYKTIADSAKPILDAIAPFQADIERHGANTPQLVHGLLQSHRTLALGSPQEKLQLLSKVAQDYGIPIQALYDQNVQQRFLAQPYTPQQPTAPNIAALVRQELENVKTHETVQSMASNTKDYPFFHYVRADMAQLLERGEATDLNDAYQKCLDLPQHSMLTTVQAAQHAQAAEQQRKAAAIETAKVARANTVSTRSATPAAAAPTGKQGVREALREAISQHAGGARV